MEFLSQFSQELILPAFIAGALVFGSLVTWFRSVKRRGKLCPHCGSITASVIPVFPLRLLGKGVSSRWCAVCGWKGLAFRPIHESLAPGGKVHLKGGFGWGSPPSPPPDGFFNWDSPGPGMDSRKDADSLPVEGPENSLPGFQWGDNPPPAGKLGFDWGGNEPKEPTPVDVPPPVPFQFSPEPVTTPPPPPPPPRRVRLSPPPFHFAGGGPDQTQPLDEAETLPPIPFRFADQPDPEAADSGKATKAPPPSALRLGFRWRG